MKKIGYLLFNLSLLLFLSLSLSTLAFASNCFHDPCNINNDNEFTHYDKVEVNDRGLCIKPGSKITYNIKNAESVIIQFESKLSPAVFKFGDKLILSPEISSENQIFHASQDYDVFYNGEVYARSKTGEFYKRVHGLSDSLISCSGNYNLKNYYGLNIAQFSSETPLNMAERISFQTSASANKRLITTYQTTATFRIKNGVDKLEIKTNFDHGCTIKSVLINGANVSISGDDFQDKNEIIPNEEFGTENNDQNALNPNIIPPGMAGNEDLQDNNFFENIGEGSLAKEEFEETQKHKNTKPPSKNNTNKKKPSKKRSQHNNSFKPKPPKTPKYHSSTRRKSPSYNNEKRKAKEENQEPDVFNFSSTNKNSSYLSNFMFLFSIVFISFLGGRVYSKKEKLKSKRWLRWYRIKQRYLI